ncbi:hypothetical protein AB9K34_17685 [Sedimentitalea sp. XS_ASV28]|uniref:hypothetical protein n=1 Tax=Sedimentitalea sp. XS_ASV28 TaxID=3241296 RepID=UPI003519031C
MLTGVFCCRTPGARILSRFINVVLGSGPVDFGTDDMSVDNGVVPIPVPATLSLPADGVGLTGWIARRCKS